MATTNYTKMQDPHSAKAEFLNEIEDQLKDIWRQYVEQLDKNGMGDEAQNLRDKYFNLYRFYKMNREWHVLVSKDMLG